MNCKCGKPLGTRYNAKTCGSGSCVARHKRWLRLMWWHRQQPRIDGQIITGPSNIPEVDYSETAVGCNIPEVDTSSMIDTRKGNRTKVGK